MKIEVDWENKKQVKEYFKEKNKEWRENNPKKAKAKNKRFKENNPDYHREWRKKNKKEIIEYNKEYEQKNKKEKVDYMKKYKQNHPEQKEKGEIRSATKNKYGKLKKGFQYHHTTIPYNVDKFIILESGFHKFHHKNPKLFNIQGQI